MDAVEGPRLVAAAPDRPAAVVVLHLAQPLDVPCHGRVDLRRGRQPAGLERGEHVPQRRHRQDTRGELLRALEGVRGQVEHGVAQRLQRRGRGRDLQAAELGEDVRRRDHRLGDGPLVELAVDRERLGRRRRPDRQLELGGIGGGRPLRDAGLLHRSHLEPGGAGAHGRRREAHFDAVICRHHHAAAGAG